MIQIGTAHGGYTTVEIVLPQPIEMREFRGDAPKIVPDAGQDGLDLGGGFLREGGAQILASGAMFRGTTLHRFSARCCSDVLSCPNPHEIRKSR